MVFYIDGDRDEFDCGLCARGWIRSVHHKNLVHTSWQVRHGVRGCLFNTHQGIVCADDRVVDLVLDVPEEAFSQNLVFSYAPLMSIRKGISFY